MNSAKNLKIKDLNSFHTEEIAYWIGVFQSDGYFKEQYVKSKKRMRYFISLSVSDKSLPILERFQKTSWKYFKIKGTRYITEYKHKLNHFRFGCKNLLELFEKLDIFHKSPVSPPEWVLRKDSYFGAYLVGIIDGDGDVRVSRPKYPQLKIRISGSTIPNRLVSEIKRFLKCGAHSIIRTKTNSLRGRVFESTGSITEFAISKKNIDFIKDFVLPFISLEYKRRKIEDYVKVKRRAVPGI